MTSLCHLTETTIQKRTSSSCNLSLVTLSILLNMLLSYLWRTVLIWLNMYFLCSRTGKNPKENKGGIVRVKIRDTLIVSKWGMHVNEEADGKTVRLSIMSSAQAMIGYYDVMVETKSKDSSGEESLHRHKHEEQICILFNAWCLGNFNRTITKNTYTAM